MLSYEEVERYLLRIFSGKEFVLVNKNGEDLFIVFKHPDNDIRMRANIIYKDAFNRATKEGMLPLKDLEKLIEERNIFTEEDQKKVDSLESKLEAQRILLSKTTKVQARQDRIKDIIKKLQGELNQIKFKKSSKLMMSAENKAEEIRSSYLCWACTYEYEKDERYWETYLDFNDEINLDFKDNVLIAFMKFYGGIPTPEIRFIARHNLWRIRYITSHKTAEQLFGVPTSEYTNDMMSLVYWSNYYQNIYEMVEERPPDSVIEDDEALDAYMEEYYKERSREDAARRSQHKNKGKLSAFDKEEVIITKSNELYEDIEYDKPREAQRLKDKDVSMIRKRTGKKRRR